MNERGEDLWKRISRGKEKPKPKSPLL